MRRKGENMKKTLSSLVLGIAGALAGCPSAPVTPAKSYDVAPVQTVSVAPVESSIVQRSIKEETLALVEYLKRSERPLCKVYSATAYLGEGVIDISWSEEKSTVRNQTIREAGIIIRQEREYSDTDCDGACDSLRGPRIGLGLDGIVRAPSADEQKEYERLVRKIVEFYRLRDAWISAHDDAPASRQSATEYSGRALRLFDHVLRNGRRFSPKHVKNYTIFEDGLEADGEKYKVFLKTSSDDLREGLSCALIEKLSASGKIIAQFSDYGVEHGLYLSPWGVCDGAFIFPGFKYSRSSEGIDAETAVQLEYERTLDKLVDAINE